MQKEEEEEASSETQRQSVGSRELARRARAEEPLGTDSHQPISKNLKRMLAPDWAQKNASFRPIGEQHMFSSFRVFVYDGY